MTAELIGILTVGVALALDPDLEIARTGLAEVRKLLRQRGQ